jgi:GT2 family glycosyltransferase
MPHPSQSPAILRDDVAPAAAQFSVIIVTWNAKKYTGECLESLARPRSASSAETIVVDNASADGTPELVKEAFPDVQLIQTGQNLGFAKGNNVGIRASTGKYLFLVNSDVNAAQCDFEKLVGYMEDHPDVGLLGPQMLGADGSVGRSTMRFPTLWNSFCRTFALDSVFKKSRLFGGFMMNDFQHDRTVDVEVLNGWFWVVRRSALDQVGLLDERFFMYGEDIDWSYRFRKAGWRAVFYAGAAAIHYGGASSSQAPTRFYIEMYRANLQYWKKHHGSLAQAGFWLSIWLHNVLRLAGFAMVYSLRPSARAKVALKMRRSVACIVWLMGLTSAQGGGGR